MKLDDISEQRLAQINPLLAAKIRELASRVAPSITFRVVQGFRTWKQQDDLYAKGRTVMSDIPCQHRDGSKYKPGTCKEHPLGASVTKAKAGQSWHNFGLAVDIGPDDPTKEGYQPKWDDENIWQVLITIGVAIGLVNGKSFHDLPHFQLTGKFGVNPDDEARQLFRDGGSIAFWREAGLEQEA